MDLKENSVVADILRWRGALHIDTGANRAARARLRRCGGLFDALTLQETHGLLARVHRAGATGVDQRVAVLAMALARMPPVESNVPFVAALGRTPDGRRPQGDERPRLSPARFGALLRAAHARDWDAFMRQMRRALALLGDAPFDAARFVADILFLNDRTLQEWTYAYWQTRAPDDAQPLIAPNETESEP